MNKLPKDVKMNIALELSPPHLIQFCLSNKGNNICNSKHFWRRKLEKDYGIDVSSNIIEDPKKLYIEKFTYVSREIERIVQALLDSEFSGFQKYLNDSFKKDLYTNFMDTYLRISEDKNNFELENSENGEDDFVSIFLDDEHEGYRDGIITDIADIALPDLLQDDYYQIFESIADAIMKLARETL